VDPNVRLTVEQALDHPWMKVNPPLLKEVHQRLSRKSTATTAAAAAPTAMKRTDTVVPLNITAPSAKSSSAPAAAKRGRPKKEVTEEDEPSEKKPKVEVIMSSDGKPLTGKGSGRRGGPGRGKKGPKDLSLLEQSTSDLIDPQQSDSQQIEIPERGRQGTKFVKKIAPAAAEQPISEPSAQGERRSARNKKAE
jgi:hypothetical protein